MRAASTSRLVLVIYIAFLALPPLSAQNTATILGTVRDQAGAVIPGATVTVRNDAIALVRNTTTDGLGNYTFPMLPVGKYVVVVDAPGFASFEATAISLEINQQARLDIQLQVGATGERVTVVAEVPLVDTTSSALGAVVSEKQVTELPLVGRNFLELATLVPGVAPAKTIPYNPSTGSKLLTQLATSASQVNGLRIQSNNYLLDGGDNNEPFYGFIAATPGPDTVLEFKILTNSYSAEFGRGGGGMVNVITRSGTNELHGVLFEFLRNDVVDARNFFSKERPPLKQNQFGGSLGGPILKDKTFFFVNYEGLRKREGLTVNTTVPSPLERQGDFSQSANPPIDPGTGLPYPSNVIPAGQIHPISQQLLQFFPPPTDGNTQFVSSISAPQDGDQVMAKIDHNLGQKGRISANYFFNDVSLQDPNPLTFAGLIGVPGFDTKDVLRVQRFVFSETHTISTHAINTFRFTYNRTVLNSGEVLDPISRFDFGFTFPGAFTDLPIFGITGLSAFGTTNAINFRTDNTFQFADDFSLVKGRHTLKFGGDIRRLRLRTDINAFDAGGFIFAPFFTGNAFADFLLGRPLLFLQLCCDNLRYWHSTQSFLYVQDDIRVTPRLTLNIGLRYELLGPLSETRGRAIAWRPGQTSTVIPNMLPGLLVVGDPGVTASTINTDFNNLAPRIGFAWDLFGDGKTSVRGAYGIFYDNVIGFTPFQLTLFPSLNLVAFLFAPPDFADPFLGNSPFAGPGPLPIPPGQQLNALSPEFTTPYAQQWNLTIQRQIAENFLLQASYVGTKGTNLAGSRDLNPADFVPGNTTVANIQQRRRNPQIGPILENGTNYNSNYHSLQLSARGGIGRNLTFSGSYTWSKAIDMTSVLHPGFTALGQQPQPQDTDNLRAERGLAAFDIRHRFVFHGIWNLPFLRRADWKGRAFGNWDISWIAQAQSGTPFTIVDSANPSLNGSFGLSDRPDLLPGCDLSRPAGFSTTARFFNTACFQALPFGSGRFGTAGRNILIGPGFTNIDLGVFKDIPIKEAMRVQFRAEFFNLLNHPNFSLPDNDVRSPTFGQIFNTIPGNERRIQFGIKFYF